MTPTSGRWRVGRPLGPEAAARARGRAPATSSCSRPGRRALPGGDPHSGSVFSEGGPRFSSPSEVGGGELLSFLTLN